MFYSNRTGPAELYISSRVDEFSDWTEPRQLTFDGGVFPQWSPNGDLIAYLTQDDTSQRRTLTLISPEGGEPSVIDLYPEISPDYAAWSHDGRSIFVKGRDADGALGVWALPISMNETPKLVLSLGDIWAGSVRFEFRVDEANFYFSVSERDSDIWIASLDQSAD